jgi:WD40 repeat protein
MRTRSKNNKSVSLLPTIPTAVIVDYILPLLDRETWIKLCCICRELYEASRGIGPPWPHTSLFVGSAVFNVVFSPNGQLLASAALDRVVRVWSRSNGRLITLDGHSNGVLRVRFSPNGNLLASAGTKTIRLYKLSDFTHQALEGHTHVITSIDFSPDGSILASGDRSGSICLWDVDDGRCTRILRDAQMGYILSISFSTDGGTLAAVGSTFNFWDLSNADNTVPTAKMGANGYSINSIAYSPDGIHVASGSNDNAVRLWNVADRSRDAVLKGHTNIITSVAFSPNGKIITSGSGNGGVQFWSVDNGGGGCNKCLVSLSRNHGSSMVRSVAFSHDGRTLASAGDDGTICLWNPNEHVRRQDEGNWDELLRLWNAQS